TARVLAEKGYQVVITARDLETAKAASVKIDGHVHYQALDVGSEESVSQFFDWLWQELGRIDVLVNNAGRVYGGHDSSLLGTTPETMAEAFNNNSLSVLRTVQHALPAMNRAGYGRIVNVSSGMGALNEMGSGAVPYRVSKTAMNAITAISAHQTTGNVKINAVCPGWVRTDMGGSSATRDVSEGAAGVVWAATLPADGPNGGFFRDGNPIEW
ncbi:MAG: SDR family NAD(P)-dependent oxidoreductase, partial [Chloroflexota bacterium]